MHTAGTGPSLEAISLWLLVGTLATFQIWEDWGWGGLLNNKAGRPLLSPGVLRESLSRK